MLEGVAMLAPRQVVPQTIFCWCKSAEWNLGDKPKRGFLKPGSGCGSSRPAALFLALLPRDGAVRGIGRCPGLAWTWTCSHAPHRGWWGRILLGCLGSISTPGVSSPASLSVPKWGSWCV